MLYALECNEKKHVLKLSVCPASIKRTVENDSVYKNADMTGIFVWNSDYMLSTSRSALRCKAQEIQAEWITKIEKELNFVREIKIK